MLQQLQEVVLQEWGSLGGRARVLEGLGELEEWLQEKPWGLQSGGPGGPEVQCLASHGQGTSLCSCSGPGWALLCCGAQGSSRVG